MVAVNDSQKQVTVHTPSVDNINGTDVYTDTDGTVVYTERHKDKKKKFSAASDKLNAQMPASKSPNIFEMMMAQKQND